MAEPLARKTGLEKLTQKIMPPSKNLGVKVSSRLEKIAAARERIFPQYGEQPDYMVEDILRAESELAKCAGCKGLPCQKRLYQRLIPIINCKEGELWISYSDCPPYSAQKKQRALDRKFTDAKLPAKYQGKTLNDYKVDADNARGVKYAKTALASGRGGFFYGACGTGKTFLASIIAQDFLKAGKSVIFIKVPKLLDNFIAIYRKESTESENELLKLLCTVDLLILDDMGMEKATRYAGTMLCKIIDARYDLEAQTIVTSNNDLSEIQTELDNAVDGKNHNGSRITDRLKEMCEVIPFKGNSRRR